VSDPFRHLKDNAWREVDAIDERLARGAIDEDGWHREMAALVVPKYLAAATPWGQSGKSGSDEDWERSRRLLTDALDRPGSFLDVGCASGYLMECVARWTGGAIEPYGLDIAPELADLARSRLPRWADRIWCANALGCWPPRRFTYIRTGLEYVPAARGQQTGSGAPTRWAAGRRADSPTSAPGWSTCPRRAAPSSSRICAPGATGW
jgi:hypothetical protein